MYKHKAMYKLIMLDYSFYASIKFKNIKNEILMEHI